MTPALFRVLVASNLAFAIAGAVVDFLSGNPSPPDAVDDSLIGILMGLLGLMLVVFAVALTIGLILFWWWARPVALWSTIIGVVTIAFGDPVQSPLADAAYVASYYLGGATLAAAYWSSISTRFDRKS